MKRDDRRPAPQEGARVGGPVTTAEEAEHSLTRLLAEWEMRARRLQREGNAAPLHLAIASGDAALATRERLIQQLAALGPLALEPLERTLRADLSSGLAQGRAAMAALALGRMGDFRAAPALIEALQMPRPDADAPASAGAAAVRAAAARALGELKAEAAASVYEQALAHQRADTWQAETARLAALRLETVLEALLGALRDPAPEVRASAADACVDLCLAEAPERLLVGKVTTAAGSAASAGNAVQAKAAPLSLAVDPLNEALKDVSAVVRARAATALGWIGDQRAAAPLIRCLKDADAGCRVAAAQALGMLRAPGALKPLAQALGDASLVVRQQVVESLGMIGDPITADLLLDVLADAAESLAVRTAAVRALERLHLPQALPIFQDLLAEPEPALRLAAVEALGSLGYGRAYRVLVPLLWRDPDRAVRHAAARAAAQLAQARQGRARWRLRLAWRISPQARQEALAILEEHARAAPA